MKQVVLKFPDIKSLAEFVVTNEVSQITTNNEERTVEGAIPDYLIRLACKGYGAVKVTITHLNTLKKPYFSFN